ncbi:MAG: hypothetical protein GY951_00005 [Psychromonas sp.]|nr:hypothetical protein [Psychromonas sp.]
MDKQLTRTQLKIYECLKNYRFQRPPYLRELCAVMGLKSRGSMHFQVQALIKAGLVCPMNNQAGIRLKRRT